MPVVRDVPAYPVPGYGLRVLRTLEAAGFEAWVVGGWVRAGTCVSRDTIDRSAPAWACSRRTSG